jgi:hydrophobe/amphiphile efflux-1 (HAE1) family protein
MTLSDLSIKRPVFAWMLFWGILFFGIVGFFNLGISQMPDVDFPVVNVRLSLPGASPEVIETNVVDIIEDALISIEGVTQINSTSNFGQANITIDLELDRNVDSAVQEVQAKILQVQKLLPINLDPPQISKYNPEDVPIIRIAVISEGDLKELMLYVRDVLKNQYSTVPGVGTVQLNGFADRNLRIWLDNKKLNTYELTVEDVNFALKKEHSEFPVGLLENSEYQKNIRSMGEAETISAFENLRIPSRGGQPILGRTIRLKDIARIEDGLEDRQRISRLNGETAVGLGIIKQRGTNAVEVSRLVRQKTDELNKNLPPGFHLKVSFDSSIFIEESIEELEFTLLISILFTGIVVYLFLGNWSSTWNILLSIPTSIIGAFFVIKVFNFTLNTFTLLALSLAIGIVVDDAIMVLENIMRHRELGKEKLLAAKDGAREITFAALATTLSIAAIFVPVLFMKGIIGKYFYQFGIVISAAVFLSLLEALTLTPMRASRYLELSEDKNFFLKGFRFILDRIDIFYGNSLNYALRFPWITIFLSVILFLGTMWTLKPLKKEFVPSMDQSRLIIKVQAKVGVSVEKMDNIAKSIEFWLKEEDEIEKYFTAVGGFQGGQSNVVNFFLTLKDLKDRRIYESGKKPISQNEFANLLRKKFKEKHKDLKVSIQDLSNRGFTSSRGFPVEISIQGKDWNILTDSTFKIIEEMKKSEFLTDIDSTYTEGAPEILIYPNRNRTSEYGVNIENIGLVLNTLVGGLKVGQFSEGGHRYDINVRLDKLGRENIEQIKLIHVRNQRGELVPLSELITYREVQSLPSITRKNRERAITIYANPGKGIDQKKAIDFALELSRNILPQSYGVFSTGSSETLKDSFESLYIALFVGIIVAYMILASQFDSFTQPIIVLMSLPFSFSGAVFALYLFNYSLNIYSFIAVLLLMGLVKKNSILLVDFTNQKRTEGLSVLESLLIACPIRLRPILMTSVATIVAAIPPALALGPGSESRIPMAIAIISGMLFSTLLTVYVVPTMYFLFYGRLQK